MSLTAPKWRCVYDAATQVEDPSKEALLSLIKTNGLEGFVEGEMKEGTGHTTYACMTIVVHED